MLNISRSREVARRGHPALAPRRRRRRPRPSRSRRRRRRWRRWRSRRRRRWRRLEHGGRWVSLKVVEMNIIHFDSTPFLIFSIKPMLHRIMCLFFAEGYPVCPWWSDSKENYHQEDAEKGQLKFFNVPWRVMMVLLVRVDSNRLGCGPLAIQRV